MGRSVDLQELSKLEVAYFYDGLFYANVVWCLTDIICVGASFLVPGQ